jgi:hypothetical protein
MLNDPAPRIEARNQRGLPSKSSCGILAPTLDGRRGYMNPIETTVALFDQGYA